jgi:hypothetical protein
MSSIFCHSCHFRPDGDGAHFHHPWAICWVRLLGLNLFSSKITVFFVLLAAWTGQPYLLDIALVYAVLGFIGTILMAKFVERR